MSETYEIILGITRNRKLTEINNMYTKIASSDLNLSPTKRSI